MQADVTPNLVRTTDFAAEAAAFLLTEIRAAIAARGLCRIALAGGQTPRAIHAEMLKQGAGLPWDHLQFTFSDERCVPPESPDSNYLMAKESLLDHLVLPPGNIFRLRGEIDPEEAAREYEEKLAAVAARYGEERYAHDIILLGMGPDGHTASLFPGSPALDETVRNVIPARGPKPPPQRLTFTFPLLNAARHVVFLAKGDDKLPLIEEIIAGRCTLPAAHVRPTNGKLTWITG